MVSVLEAICRNGSQSLHHSVVIKRQRTMLLKLGLDKTEPPASSGSILGYSKYGLRLFSHCRNFSSKVSLNFRNAFAHFKTDEVDHVSVVLFQYLSNSFAWVDNERLARQRNFAGEFLHAAFNHFLCDFFRFARLHGDVQLNLVLFFYHFSRHIFRLNEFRLARCNVHSNLLNQLFVSTFSSNQNTDACTVQIATQHIAFQRSDTANVDVLTDFSNQCNTLFFELCFQHFNISDFARSSSIQHFVSKSLETSIFSNKVSLAVNFQNQTVVAIDLSFDHAVSRYVACFFRRFDRARFTHIFNRQLDVAIRFNQRFLTIHHASASTFAQFFYQGSGNISHCIFLDYLGAKRDFAVRYFSHLR